MHQVIYSGLLLSGAALLCGCGTMNIDTEHTRSREIRSYAGVVLSKSEEHQGTVAPAMLVTVPTEDGVACRMVFFLAADAPVLLKGTVRDTQDSELSGTWRDPRGWDVTWKIRLKGNTVIGTFKQPHDFGDIRLKRVE
jgi:uncharacterized protein YceK